MGRGPAKAVLVAFCARDGDPYQRDRVTGDFRSSDKLDQNSWGPALRLLADKRSGLRGHVSDFYYLCHPSESLTPTRKRGRRAMDVADETRAALELHLEPPQRPTFHPVTWQTDKPPNDHQDLFKFVRKKLREIREAHPDVELVLQLSSGTSAMHAALLIAGSVGVVRGPLRLIQSERGDGAIRRIDSPYAELGFELPTILRVAADTISSRPGEDAAPTLAYDQAESPALRRALASAAKAARTRFPVLLRGERGVGKSSLAKFIRAASPYRKRDRDHAWPSIACGQLSDPTLLYTELCGAVKGAYTGLQSNREGLLHAANGDTLFLDEIHDLDHRCQRAIIRVIEDGTYTRMGEEKIVRHSRFRLITGTNQSDDVLGERLSPDFLDRIRDLEIEIPPLRACREDLPWMWRATLERAAVDEGVVLQRLTEHDGLVLKTLNRAPLNGNWRDLRRLAARMTVEHLAGELDHRTVEVILREFEESGTAGAASVTGRAEPQFSDQAAVRRHMELEEILGPGLSAFWGALGKGKPARLVLLEQLRDRHRAARALKFIRESYPSRSKILGNGATSGS